ncbi:MAG TPA: hypothetical protein VNO17_10510 [Actinomycetota bacterium]|nr:hypothetical protein [Actinomycetota bacterium]
MAKVKVGPMFGHDERGSWDLLADPVFLPHGYVIPRRFPVSADLEDGTTAELVVEVKEGRARATEVTVRRPAGITRRTLSAVPVRNIVFTACTLALWRTRVGAGSELVLEPELGPEAEEVIRDLVGYAPEKLEVEP